MVTRVSKRREHQVLKFSLEQIDVWIQLCYEDVPDSLDCRRPGSCLNVCDIKEAARWWNWCTSLKASTFLASKEMSVSLDELCKQDNRFFGLSSSVGAGALSEQWLWLQGLQKLGILDAPWCGNSWTPQGNLQGFALKESTRVSLLRLKVKILPHGALPALLPIYPRLFLPLASWPCPPQLFIPHPPCMLLPFALPFVPLLCPQGRSLFFIRLCYFLKYWWKTFKFSLLTRPSIIFCAVCCTELISSSKAPP